MNMNIINGLFNFMSACIDKNGSEVLSSDTVVFLSYFVNAIFVSTPVIVLLLISIDVVKAVSSGKEDDMKHAQSAAIKRILIGVVIMLLPVLMNVLFVFLDFRTCSIW